MKNTISTKLNRVRRRRFRSFASLPLVMLAVIIISENFSYEYTVLTIIIGTLVILYFWITQYFTICPRCSKTFFLKGLFYGNMFSGKCLNCKISLKWKISESELQSINQWLNEVNPKIPIPDVGLTCPTCNYSVTGLTEQRCPECGHRFDISKMIYGENH